MTSPPFVPPLHKCGEGETGGEVNDYAGKKETYSYPGGRFLR